MTRPAPAHWKPTRRRAAWALSTAALLALAGAQVGGPASGAAARSSPGTAPSSPVVPRPSPTASPASPVSGFGRLRAAHVRYEVRTQVLTATGDARLSIGDAEITAERLRVDQAARIATAEGGVVVQRGGTRLGAPRVRYAFDAETAEATGGAELRQADATIRASQMTFDLRRELTVATGGVTVVEGQRTLVAERLTHDGRSGDVTAEGKVSLKQPGVHLAGDRLVANLPARRGDMRGNVVFVRAPESSLAPGQRSGGPVAGASPAPSAAPSPRAVASASPSAPATPAAGPSDRAGDALAREQTTVTAGRMVFRWDVNEAEAEGDVVVRQRDKTAWADRMTYSEPANRLVMIGRVVLEQTSGEWLVREGIVGSPRDPREREALTSLTRMTCRRLTMTLRERDMVADGPLEVTQKGRAATGDRGAYTEATKLLVLTGNVRMRDADGQRLRADRVVISLVEETFEAEGNVETEFSVRASPRSAQTPRPSPTGTRP